MFQNGEETSIARHGVALWHLVGLVGVRLTVFRSGSWISQNEVLEVSLGIIKGNFF